MFNCIRFLLTGSALLFGLLGLNHTPMPAWASVVPFAMHDLSIYAMMFGGVCVLGSLLAVSKEHFVGFVKILKFLCISPEDDTS